MPDTKTTRRYGGDLFTTDCEAGPHAWRPTFGAKLRLNWDKLHPMSRQEAATGVLSTDYAARTSWADLECWQRQDIRGNLETRSRGRVTIGGEL